MNTSRKTAAIVGVLYILGTVMGVLSVIFTGPILDDPNYLVKVFENQSQLVIAALMVLTMCLALAMIPFLMFPVLKKVNETWAVGYVVFRGALETLAGIGTVVSDALRTAPVRLALVSSPTALRPGTFGRARIRTAVHGTTLPSEAVLVKGGTDTIDYVATGDDTFERRSVVVGRPLDGRVQVMSGLRPGDRVVVQGALLLDGSAEQLL